MLERKTAPNHLMSREELINAVLHPKALSTFYADQWDTGHLQQAQAHSGDVPLTDWGSVCRIPFTKRLYKAEHLLTIVAHPKRKPALIARTVSDIAQEPLPLEHTRPLVAFDSLGDSLFWSVWCYEHNILPLIGDENMPILALAAKKYRIDSIVGNPETIREIARAMEQTVRNEVVSVHVMFDDDAVHLPTFSDLFANARITYWLYSAETGLLGRAVPASSQLVFTPAVDVHAEVAEGCLTVSKLRMLPLPCIRYKTRFQVDVTQHAFALSSVTYD